MNPLSRCAEFTINVVKKYVMEFEKKVRIISE